MISPISSFYAAPTSSVRANYAAGATSSSAVSVQEQAASQTVTPTSRTERSQEAEKTQTPKTETETVRSALGGASPAGVGTNFDRYA